MQTTQTLLQQLAESIATQNRDGSLIGRGGKWSVPDFAGTYLFDTAYPMGQWMVMDLFSKDWVMTGVTSQVENEPTATNILTDEDTFHFFPQPGHFAQWDFGFRPRDAKNR